jgi:ankyrin repeat protein
MTPLHFVARGGRTEFVRLLLEHGADANVRDEFGDTPSQLASRYELPEIVELLSEYGAEFVYEYGAESVYDYVEEA